MKKLWLTYAWKDNEDKDVDFIIQELDKTDIEVRFDRRQIIPGRRLWPQIGGFITDPKECDAWGILLTANSVKSEACVEELCYALHRALSTKGETFPVFALLHHIAPRDMPPVLSIRLDISLEDSDWVERVVAAVKGVSPGFVPTGIPDFVLTEHRTSEGYCLEIRPRFERIAPFAVAVDYDEKASGNVTRCGMGPVNKIQTGYVAYNRIDSETTLTDGTHAWVWGADNEANSTFSYYLFYKKRPKRIWFGHQQNLRMLVFKSCCD
jgi:hypothetical protein